MKGVQGNVSDEETIREVQRVELEMLKAVAALCDAHGIRYSLYCGTLLGAIRHGGFIPWDDDVDLMMPLPDYRRFLKVAKCLPDKYELRSPENDMHAIVPWAKVYANGTTVLPVFAASIDTHWGAYLDIYPMIGAAKTDFGRKAQTKMIELARRLRAAEFYRCQNAVGHSGSGWKKLAKKIIVRLPFGLLAWLSNLLIGISVRNPEHAERIGTIDAVEFAGKFDGRDWDELVHVPFEDCELAAPKNYDKLLSIMYGDYMTPPPELARTPHYEAEGPVIRDMQRDFREYRSEILRRG